MLRLTKLVRVLEHLEQSFLRHFFRVLPVTAHQPARVENLGTEVLDKPVERFRLPFQ